MGPQQSYPPVKRLLMQRFAKFRDLCVRGTRTKDRAAWLGRHSREIYLVDGGLWLCFIGFRLVIHLQLTADRVGLRERLTW